MKLVINLHADEINMFLDKEKEIDRMYKMLMKK